MAKVKNRNKLWTVREVAEHFRRSPKTIYRWIDSGIIENVIKVADGYLIPDREIRKIISSDSKTSNLK